MARCGMICLIRAVTLRDSRLSLSKFIASAFFSLVLLTLIAGCGQVITRVSPTPSSAPIPGVTLAVAATARPTSTPAPYTPAPTATPTVTPTPVIYRIASGDNLLKIAQKFGVSVAGIQDANGITDPRSLRVGQELLIPVEEAEELAAGTPTLEPTPLPFAVENLTFANTPLGGLWCFGEIRELHRRGSRAGRRQHSTAGRSAVRLLLTSRLTWGSIC